MKIFLSETKRKGKRAVDLCSRSKINFVDKMEIGLNEWWTKNIGRNLNIEEQVLT